MCRYLTSVLLIVCGFCGVIWASESTANTNPQSACVDSDADGLEDSLEAKLGTDPARADTDGDGLGDYEEYCKYRTDPTKKDTDGDGIPDGDWQERREYAYTIRAICEIRPPNNADLMNDLYQDVRPAGRKARLANGTVVEILLFPFSTPHVFAQPYPRCPDSGVAAKVRRARSLDELLRRNAEGNQGEDRPGATAPISRRSRRSLLDGPRDPARQRSPGTRLLQRGGQPDRLAAVAGQSRERPGTPADELLRRRDVQEPPARDVQLDGHPAGDHAAGRRSSRPA